MKKRRLLRITLSAALLLVLFSFSGKPAGDPPADIPRCLQKRIKKKSKCSVCLKSVYKYEYNGEDVYLFEGGASPVYTMTLYDKQCRVLWEVNSASEKQPEGTSATVQDFMEKRKEGKLVWGSR